MARQAEGEKLNVSCVLTWGPCYYYRKKFFTGKDDPPSKPDRLMHYDLEVSGFPSSHAGHLVLLGLTEQDYPGTERIEDWRRGICQFFAGVNRKKLSWDSHTQVLAWR